MAKKRPASSPKRPAAALAAKKPAAAAKASAKGAGSKKAAPASAARRPSSSSATKKTPAKKPAPVIMGAVSDDGVPTDRPVRVYADGIFDLFHFGHARALEQAKKLFPNTYLMVGCCSDAVTHAYKGKTVLTEEERYESLRHCKWVDEVVPNAPWVITADFLSRHNIDFVAHDDLPYADASGQTDDVYGPVKALGKFRATQRTEGVSTSDVILRILRDYNEYVLRNLSRGYSRKDLGISALKEQRIRASARMRRLSQQLREQRLRMASRLLPGGGGSGGRHAGSGGAGAAANGAAARGGRGDEDDADDLATAMAAAVAAAGLDASASPETSLGGGGGGAGGGGSPTSSGLVLGAGGGNRASAAAADNNNKRRRTLLPPEMEARSRELAEMIRRNGEELAQTVENFVGLVTGGGGGGGGGGGRGGEGGSGSGNANGGAGAGPSSSAGAALPNPGAAAAALDRSARGFLRTLEGSYQKLEEAIRGSVLPQHGAGGGGGGGGGRHGSGGGNRPPSSAGQKRKRSRLAKGTR